MNYLTLDTCVWIELLKVDFYNDDNLFDEICYWIENKHIIHIAPENIIREWNRHKIPRLEQAVKDVQTLQHNNFKPFKHNIELASTYQPDSIKEKITERINKIDNILNVLSEKAPETPEIINEAGSRNLLCLAPNHFQDSYRDSVNILCLINYIKQNSKKPAIFSTLNYKDFSENGNSKYKIHPQLEADFTNSNLVYIFFDEKENFGKKLFGILRKELPSYLEQIKEKERHVQEDELAKKKSLPASKIENPDKDFIENIKYIDMIILKGTRTPFEDEMIASLIKRHESYKQYFFKNISK